MMYKLTWRLVVVSCNQTPSQFLTKLPKLSYCCAKISLNISHYFLSKPRKKLGDNFKLTFERFFLCYINWKYLAVAMFHLKSFISRFYFSKLLYKAIVMRVYNSSCLKIKNQVVGASCRKFQSISVRYERNIVATGS